MKISNSIFEFFDKNSSDEISFIGLIYLFMNLSYICLILSFVFPMDKVKLKKFVKISPILNSQNKKNKTINSIVKLSIKYK